MSRNESEKLRRDRLNALMYELAQHVPLIPPSDRKMDKSSVLRLTVNYLRIHGELRYASPALPDFPKLQNNATGYQLISVICDKITWWRILGYRS